MGKEKNHKTPTGWEGELKKEPVNYDIKASQIELVRMFELLKIRFDNHIELAKRENRLNTSLNGLYQSFLKTFNGLEKLDVRV
jgi:hypothetical protein